MGLVPCLARSARDKDSLLQGNGLFEAGSLPQLPSNAQYVYHENKCYDWGTFGWALSSGKVDPSKYKHIIFMNSSIRGPFLPPYWPVRPAECLSIIAGSAAVHARKQSPAAAALPSFMK